MGYILYDVQLPLTIEKNPHGLCTNAGGERRRGGHLRQRRLGLQDRGLALAPGRRQGGHGGAMAGPWRGHGGAIGAMAELGWCDFTILNGYFGGYLQAWSSSKRATDSKKPCIAGLWFQT